ncbi:BON domain-containing protein [Paludibacterium yongneupense]|uniref:BON domain-containing protein n=1 Tax=Paludibacterium yongneupense TaxID=400061 RepID=UPI00041B174E|nr:BON domain-containing protein [Paludibacterium yongneupense]
MRRGWLALGCAAVLASTLSGCLFPLVAGGAVGATLVASDRRSTGTYVNDQTIELKAGNQISTRLPTAHVNVTSFNQTVLMTGEVPSDEARREAETIVRALPNVRRVQNYTVVDVASTLGQRNNDAWITAKVRGRLLDGKYASQALKVVTERGVVYLLGLVSHTEGDAATTVVSETSGVLKVVTLFEYISDVPSAQ